MKRGHDFLGPVVFFFLRLFVFGVFFACVYLLITFNTQENGTKAWFFLYQFLVCQSEIQLHKSWKICSISWVNLHLTDLAFCQLIWMEKGAASAKNAFDSLFIYMN